VQVGLAAVGLRLPDGLPNREYAISDGTVSVIPLAGCCPVTVRKAAKGRLEAVIRSNGFLRLHFCSPARPSFVVDGREIGVHWSERRSEGVAAVAEAGELSVMIQEAS